MKVFLITLLGSMLIAPFAHSHGGHDHGSAGEATFMPVGNENGAVINLYRDKSCSCCSKWGASMAQAGYRVVDHISDEMSSLKEEEGISSDVASCHTAFISGYFIEGHVPARREQLPIAFPPILNRDAQIEPKRQCGSASKQ